MGAAGGGGQTGAPVWGSPLAGQQTAGTGGTSFGAADLKEAANRLDRALDPLLPGGSVWVLAAVAILGAFALAWFDALLAAIQHYPDPIPGQERALRLLSPAGIRWAELLLVAVLIIDIGRYFGRRSPLERLVLLGLVLGAVLVMVGAALSILVELTYFGHGIDRAFQGMIGALVAMLVSSVAAIGAWRLRRRA